MATIDMKTLKFENDENTYKVVDGDAVHISAQTLSDIQKTQVLNNIGAAAAGHSHTPAAIGAAEADHTHITSEVSYNTTKITVDIDPSPIQTGVSIQQVDGTGKTTGYPINYGAMVAFKGGVNRGFILAGGKGDGQQMYVRGLTTESGTLDWSKIYTSIDVRCQDTAPTANLAKGQLWLKPI